MNVKRFIRIFLLIFLFPNALNAQLVQWRGPDRDGKYPASGLMQEWPADRPSLLLKKEGLGAGWTTPVISENVIYISGRRESLEVLTAVKMDGSVLWETIFDNSWQSSFPDSRNSPTIEGDRIYIAGGMGMVNCINKADGKIIWHVNTHDKFKGEFHRWGFAESLLLTENAVISSPTGSETVMVALDKKDGSLLWKTEGLGDVRAYASPLMINHNGQNIIVAQTNRHVLGVDPQNGKILWKFDLVTGLTPEDRRNNTNTPLYHQGELFVTSGYDATALMLKLSDDGKSVSLKWKTDVLDTHHGGVVLIDGYIYGSNWINNGNGNWCCLEWESGKVMYEEAWFNKGSIIFADGRLYIYEEKTGNFGLLIPDPSGFRLAGSFQVKDGTGPHWAHPSIYNNKLLVRHGEVLLVYDLLKQN